MKRTQDYGDEWEVVIGGDRCWVRLNDVGLDPENGQQTDIYLDKHDLVEMLADVLEEEKGRR